MREDLGERSGARAETLLASGKTGAGVAEILHAIVERVPPPHGDPEAPLRALIFDSHYDQYKGVVAHIRVMDGSLAAGDRILLMATAKESELAELGVFAPDAVRRERLEAGEVGYAATGLGGGRPRRRHAHAGGAAPPSRSRYRRRNGFRLPPRSALPC